MSDIIPNLSGYEWMSFTGTTGYPDYSEPAINNAKIILYFCNRLGWSDKACAAFLSAVNAECSMNPQETEAGGAGYGLVQWTPPSDLDNVLSVIYGGQADRTDGTQQMNAIIAEWQQTNYGQHHPDAVNRGIERQWYNSTGSRYEKDLPLLDWYIWATDESYSLETLTDVFIVNYLRPYSPNWNKRHEYAAWWYEWILAQNPRTIRWWMFHRMKRT